MESSASRADGTVKQAKEARQSLRSITGAINTISEMNTQIASAAEQQGTVAEDINQRISAIRDVTDETAAGAEQTSASAAELARLGENLRGVVGSFRI